MNDRNSKAQQKLQALAASAAQYINSVPPDKNVVSFTKIKKVLDCYQIGFAKFYKIVDYTQPLVDGWQTDHKSFVRTNPLFADSNEDKSPASTSGG